MSAEQTKLQKYGTLIGPTVAIIVALTRGMIPGLEVAVPYLLAAALYAAIPKHHLKWYQERAELPSALVPSTLGKAISIARELLVVAIVSIPLAIVACSIFFEKVPALVAARMPGIITRVAGSQQMQRIDVSEWLHSRVPPFTDAAIVGRLTGTSLVLVPSQLVVAEVISPVTTLVSQIGCSFLPLIFMVIVALVMAETIGQHVVEVVVRISGDPSNPPGQSRASTSNPPAISHKTDETNVATNPFFPALSSVLRESAESRPSEQKSPSPSMSSPGSDRPATTVATHVGLAPSDIVPAQSLPSAVDISREDDHS